MESVNNKTFTPLEAGRAYIGSFEKIDPYSSCVISLISDQNCLITVYQSQNKTAEFSTQFSYTTPNTQFNVNFALTAPYVYFVVRNEGMVAQTYLYFTVIYKTAYTQAGSGANSNIFDSNGNNLLSDGSGNLGVKLKAVDSSLIQDDGLKTYIVNSTLPFAPVVQRTSLKVWSGASISTGATSAKFDVSEISSTNLSVYGNTSASGIIAVLFSQDNTSFYASQYTTEISISGDFGFSCPVSAPYIRLLWTGSNATITAVASAS